MFKFVLLLAVLGQALARPGGLAPIDTPGAFGYSGLVPASGMPGPLAAPGTVPAAVSQQSRVDIISKPAVAYDVSHGADASFFGAYGAHHPYVHRGFGGYSGYGGYGYDAPVGYSGHTGYGPVGYIDHVGHVDHVSHLGDIGYAGHVRHVY